MQAGDSIRALGQAQTAALLMPGESDLQRYGRVFWKTC